MISEIERHIGKWEIYRNGKLFAIKYNMITNVALNNFIRLLYTSAITMNIKYLAIGNDASAISPLSNKLGNEIFRTPFITTPAFVSTGKVSAGFQITQNEALGTWREIGLFGGDDATETKDSGILISRILYYHVKNDSEDFIFIRTDEIVRG